MSISAQTIIGELVASDYRTAAVFKRNGVDFCCNGNTTISDACQKKKIDELALIEDLVAITSSTNSDTNVDFQSWPLDLLADYIEKRHHRYVELKIREITPFLNKVARVHGERHPELLEVESLFRASAIELSEHMIKEERIVFPFVRQLVTGAETVSGLRSVQQPIAVMMNEHSAEGERFRRIAEITNDYTPPADACNTYMVTFKLLQEFEENLHEHIHLENNILFPKAIAMEASLVATAF
ncbi:MAG TPA: iron-sulfur cluster repair di-iron protein [Phnomibacter sp.]|nr:iron-sulfur cluster repair di-iron protein [Phnomibacter sp.]